MIAEEIIARIDRSDQSRLSSLRTNSKPFQAPTSVNDFSCNMTIFNYFLGATTKLNQPFDRESNCGSEKSRELDIHPRQKLLLTYYFAKLLPMT